MKKYSGELRRLGTGRVEMQYGQSKYAVIEIGDEILKKIVANELTNSYLDVGAKLSLWVGPIFFTNYIYAIGLEDGRIVKSGLGMFIGSLAMKLFLLLVLSPMLAGEGPLPILWFTLAGWFGYRTFRAISGYNSIA